MENIAILQLKADRIRDERALLEREMQSREVELSVIADLGQNRSRAGGKVLQKLLKKVDLLQEELEKPEYEENGLRGAISEELDEAPEIDNLDDDNIKHSSFAKLIDKVSEVRETRWQTQVRELEAELSSLCHERNQLAAQEAKVKAKQKEHALLMSKGVDFLVEMELGNAPPVELILQNLKEEAEEQEQGEGAKTKPTGGLLLQIEETVETMEELLENAEKSMDVTSKRIKDLQVNLEELHEETERTKPGRRLFGGGRDYDDETPYDGSEGRGSVPLHLAETFDMIRELVSESVDEIMQGVHFDRPKQLLEAEGALVKWQASRSTLLRQIEDSERENGVRAMNDEFTTKVIESVIRGIYGEMVTARELSSKISRQIIMNSLRSLRPIKNGQQQKPGSAIDSKVKAAIIKDTFLEMQRTRDTHLEEETKHSRIPPRNMSQELSKPVLPQEVSLFYSTNSAYNADSMARIQEELERRKKAEETYEANKNALRHGIIDEGDAADEDAANEDASKEKGSNPSEEFEGSTVLDLGLVPLFSTEQLEQRAPEFPHREREFWNNIHFRSKHTKVQSRAFGTPSATALSTAGEYLAVGTGLGAVLVYDLRKDKEGRLVRKFVQKKAEDKLLIKQICWSLDCGSRLAALDEDGIVRVFSTSTVEGPTGGSFAKKKPFAPRSLKLLLELSGKHFARPEQASILEEEDEQDLNLTAAQIREKIRREKARKRALRAEKQRRRNKIKQDPQDLKAVHITFHVSHTMLGVQTSLLIGLVNGTIVKWNLNSGTASEEKSIFCPVHAASEPKNPIEASFEPGRPRERGKLFGSTICREFLQDHMAPIMFAGHVNRTSEMLYTSDENHMLKLWSYDPTSYSGFGWYTPMEHFVIQLKAIAYNADTSKKVEDVFPPVGISVPAVPKGSSKTEDQVLMENAEFMQCQEEELRHVATMGLHEEPWMAKSVGTKGRYMHIHAPEHYTDEESAPHQVLIFSKGGILVKRLVSYFTPIVFSGKLCDMQMSPSGTEIVMLVLYPATDMKSEMLRIFLFDTHTQQLEQTSIEVPLEGSILPKLALSPVLCGLGSDYAYILMNNEVHCLSLTSGSYVCRRLKPVEKEPGVSLTSIQVAADHEHLVCCAAQNETVYLFAIEDRNDPASFPPPKQDEYRPRLEHTFPELLI